MPRAIYAEDIERFLGALDGVASARVSTTQAGEIDHVYVVAERAVDARAVRSAVAAALVSAYGLQVEPSRIQVTLFREGLRSAEIPRFRVAHVEETVSPAEVAATVRIAWARGGEEKAVTGRARGSAGPAYRARVLAAATLDAVRETLDPGHRKASVQQASRVTFLDQPVAVVALAVPTAEGREVCFGVAPQRDAPEPMVAATLDAVSRWLLKAAAGAAPSHGEGRRGRLEAMRRFVRSHERPDGALRAGGPTRMPGPPAEPHDGGAATDVTEDRASGGPSGADGAADLGATPGTRPDAHASDDPDILDDLRQIRPESARPGPEPVHPEVQGGAAMATQHEPARAGAVPARGHVGMEDSFYRSLIERRTPVHLRCRDGYELPHAVIKEAGTYVILLETPGGTELVFKHAIISIRVPSAGAFHA